MQCYNCGGELYLRSDEQTIVCRSCGASQPLGAGNAHNAICSSSDAAALLAYYRATQKMNTASSSQEFQMAATMFTQLRDVLDAPMLAKHCAEKSAALYDKEQYERAIDDKQSGDLARLRRAKGAFAAIPHYRDAAAQAAACTPLIEEAERAQARHEQAALARKRQLRGLCGMLALIIVAAFALILLARSCAHAASHIQILLTPSDPFVTTTYSGYCFSYDALIENHGSLDVKQIEGSVTIQSGDHVLVDTSIGFYNSGSAVVRAKKSAAYTWELKVKSDQLAAQLYENAADYSVIVHIEKLVFSDGTTKTY